MLVRLVGIVAPGAGPGLQLGAGLDARRMRDAVRTLAGIRRRAHVDIQMARAVDDHRMHGMVAAQRQAGDDRGRLTLRRDLTVDERIAHDAIIDLGVEPVLVDGDAGAAMAAGRRRFAEALHDIGVPVVMRVLECDQEAAGRRRVVLVVPAAPGVDVEHTVGRDDHLPRVAELVGEHGGAEPGRQGDAGIIVAGGTTGRRGAGGRVFRLAVARLGVADGQRQYGCECDCGQRRQDHAVAGNAICHVLRSFLIEPSQAPFPGEV